LRDRLDQWWEHHWRDRLVYRIDQCWDHDGRRWLVHGIVYRLLHGRVFERMLAPVPGRSILHQQ
jgi:hypothetical protein